jgi:hypothetical protein
MTVAAGANNYEVHHSPVQARGLVFDQADLDSMLANEVREILLDIQGKQEIAGLLAGVVQTDFQSTALQGILDVSRLMDPWRVGEAIAECYLVAHRQCEFPWPGGRDLKNPNSSPAGTDLVGFQTYDNSSVRFSFAEVKTSADPSYPPSLMYGRHGMKQQLDDLRDSNVVKNALVLYLGLHAKGRTWAETFKKAAARYLNEQSDVCIFGVFVRDVAPHADDCSGRASKLANQCPPSTVIELLALYFPAESIETFANYIDTVEASQ